MSRDRLSIRQFPGVERGPASAPWSDTGHDWLDRRMDASAIDGAFQAVNRQRLIKQLGEVSWDDHPESGQRPKGPREQPLNPDVRHVFRSMSEDDFQASQARGYIQSDGRGAIDPSWEGTNAATNPGTAHVYMPRQGTGRIVKMAVYNDDGWFASNVDSYARTRSPIPWSRVEAHTEAFAHPDSDAAPETFRDQVKRLERS